MLDTLFASRGRPGGSKKSAAMSVLVHAAIIGGVVYGTARAVTPPEPKEQREEKIAYVAPKPEPEPLPKEAPKVRVEPKKAAPAPAPKKVAPPKPRPAPPKPAPAPAPKVAVAPVAPPTVVPEKIPEVTAPAAPPGPTAAELAAKAAAAAEAELAAAKARADAEAASAAAAAAKARVESESAGEVSSNRSYDEAQVDVAVRPLGGAPAPKYPEHLRASNVQGQVSVRFIVGTNGRVEEGSIKIIDSPDPAFSEEVKRVLMRTRYRPAEAGGHKVRQIVEQAFTFRLNS